VKIIEVKIIEAKTSEIKPAAPESREVVDLEQQIIVISYVVHVRTTLINTIQNRPEQNCQPGTDKIKNQESK
jgi:hypothetical protein